MTEKQKRFCDEYLIDCNATRAYKAVYKNIKNDSVARKAGSRLLTVVDVKKYIDARMEELHNEKTADAQEVIEYLSAVLRGESTAQEIVVVGTGDGCSEAKTVEKAPSEKERLKAAELLGKRYGLYTDKIEQTVDAELNITVDYGEDPNENFRPDEPMLSGS